VEPQGSLATLTFQQVHQKPAQAAGCHASDFARIVREHQSMVFSVAYHFLRDRAAAEEVAQEHFCAFTGIWNPSNHPVTCSIGCAR